MHTLTDNELGILQGALDWATVENSKDRRGEESEWNQSAWCGTAYCIAGKMCLDAGWQMFTRSEVPIDIDSRRALDPDTINNTNSGWFWATSSGFVVKDGVYREAGDVAQSLLGTDETGDLFREDNNLNALWSIGQVLAEGRLAIPDNVRLYGTLMVSQFEKIMEEQ